MNIAILGVGTVGEAVVKILEKNKKIITARSGEEIRPLIGVVRNLNKKRDINLPLTDNIDDVINRDDIDVFVELMGGVDEPKRIVSHILNRGKAVVTANKALLAYHRLELQNLAAQTPFGFEASV
ncbi:MAG: homoserine dehydrogenase, partial [Campylobacter sp.]